ncbi:MAG: peptidylprolyl isomerase [Oscillospiraceae bacterium]|nr:peptidylprolyl isomerase [Oscillospiraceae bacterium]
MNFRKLTALLLAAAMLLGLLTACGSSEPAPTEATEAPTEAPEAPFNGDTDVTALNNYAVLEASPHDRNMASVIALDADGSPAMTNSILQFVYWLEFFNFMNSYGSYASYFGLDAYTPLAEQTSMAEDRTWEQYFLEDATKGFAQQYALYREANATGFAISDEARATLDDILDPNGSIATGAASAGFDSALEYMQNTFGPGVDLQDYYDYVTVYITGNAYYTHLYDLAAEEAENADEATLSAYYDAHAEDYAAERVEKVNNVSVRHILITPEGEKDPETGDYSEEAWAAAEETANAVYAEWQQDPTEDNFAALANEKSADPGSNTEGGLYEDFDTATMVAEFTSWSFDPARAYGDTGIVKTSYGYHIMFFVGQTENRGWVDHVRTDMQEASVSEKIEEICSRWPITFDYTRMRVFDIVSMMAAEETAQQESEPLQETLILPEDTFEP